MTQFLLVRSKQGLGWDRVCEAQRSNESPSGAFKRQRGLRQQMEGRCPDKRYPNKITSKLARVADVKSRWSTTFSRIENLWPRDGSCPLPLRSKRIFNKCFRIVKTQKISRGCAAHVWESPFAPNEVPAPVCAAALTKSRYHVRSAHEIFKVQSSLKKKNTAHAAQR